MTLTAKSINHLKSPSSPEIKTAEIQGIFDSLEKKAQATLSVRSYQNSFSRDNEVFNELEQQLLAVLQEDDISELMSALHDLKTYEIDKTNAELSQKITTLLTATVKIYLTKIFNNIGKNTTPNVTKSHIEKLNIEHLLLLAKRANHIVQQHLAGSELNLSEQEHDNNAGYLNKIKSLCLQHKELCIDFIKSCFAGIAELSDNINETSAIEITNLFTNIYLLADFISHDNQNNPSESKASADTVSETIRTIIKSLAPNIRQSALVGLWLYEFFCKQKILEVDEIQAELDKLTAKPKNNKNLINIANRQLKNLLRNDYVRDGDSSYTALCWTNIYGHLDNLTPLSEQCHKRHEKFKQKITVLLGDQVRPLAKLIQPLQDSICTLMDEVIFQLNPNDKKACRSLLDFYEIFECYLLDEKKDGYLFTAIKHLPTDELKQKIINLIIIKNNKITLETLTIYKNQKDLFEKLSLYINKYNIAEENNYGKLNINFNLFEAIVREKPLLSESQLMLIAKYLNEEFIQLPQINIATKTQIFRLFADYIELNQTELISPQLKNVLQIIINNIDKHNAQLNLLISYMSRNENKSNMHYQSVYDYLTKHTALFMVKNKKIAVDYLEARIHLDETIKREQATQPKLCDAAKNITKQSDIFIKKKDKDIKLSQLTKMLASTNEVLEKPDDFTTLDTYSNNLRPIIASKTRTGKNLAAAGTLLLGLAVLFIVPAIISIHIGMFTIPLGLLAIGIGYLLHKKANNAKNCLQPFSIFADKKRHQHYEQIKKQNEANKFKTSLKTFMDAKKKNSPEQNTDQIVTEDTINNSALTLN